MQDDQVDTASSPAALVTVGVERDVATLPPALPTALPPSAVPPDPDRALHSDPHDFAGLYIRHRSSFTLHARRYLHDARDADEVVQEAFLRLFLALPELETELQALAYCRRTITNLCIDRYRAQARRPRLVDLDSVPAEDLADDDTVDPVVRAEDAAVVRDALSMLSPLHRAALVKREIEEKPLPVIAGELEIPEDSVKHVLFRARRALRRLLTATSVAPGADDEAGLGLARAGSAGLAALLLLVALGLGSGPDFRAIPVVGDDLPDLPGVTDLAKAVGDAVEDVSRAVTSSVGVPESMGGAGGGAAGQGGGDPVPLSAGDVSTSPVPAQPQLGPAALPPSAAGGSSPASALTSSPLLSPVQGDAELPGTVVDARGGTTTETGADPSDAVTGTTEQAPTSDQIPRRGGPDSGDTARPGTGPAQPDGLSAPTGRPPGGTADHGPDRPGELVRGGATGSGDGRAPQAEPVTSAPPATPAKPAPQGRPAEAAGPAGPPTSAPAPQARPAPQAEPAKPGKAKAAKAAPQAKPARTTKPDKAAKAAQPGKQRGAAKSAKQAQLAAAVQDGATGAPDAAPTGVTGPTDAPTGGQ